MATARATATGGDESAAAVMLQGALWSLRRRERANAELTAELEATLADYLWIAVVEAWELLLAAASGDAAGLKDSSADPALEHAADTFVSAARRAFPHLSAEQPGLVTQLELIVRELRDQAPALATHTVWHALREGDAQGGGRAARVRSVERLVDSFRLREYEALSAIFLAGSSGADRLLWGALEVVLRQSIDDDPVLRERFHVIVSMFDDEACFDALVRLSDAWKRWPRHSRPAPPGLVEGALAADENVQFTVYRPNAVAPMKWATLLAFAHLSDRRPDAPADEPDPLDEVERQAAEALGAELDSFQQLVEDTRHAIPQRGVLTFVPSVPGVEFNPPRASFEWNESVHKVSFRLRASASLEGKTARGDMSVYLGGILVADLQLALVVNAKRAGARKKRRLEREPMNRYRRIFASYAHLDAEVVSQIQAYAKALGDEYLMDAIHLRSGEVWSDALRELIERADVFQLFWSWNSMSSEFVRSEWEHALSLGRARFVRPTYWQVPMPQLPEKALPPPALARIHFQHISTMSDAAAPAPAPADQDAAPAAPRAGSRISWVAKALTAAVVFFCAMIPLRMGDHPPSISVEPPPWTTQPPGAGSIALPTSPPIGTATPGPDITYETENILVTVADAPLKTRVIIDGKEGGRLSRPIVLPKDRKLHELVFVNPTGRVIARRSVIADRDQLIHLRERPPSAKPGHPGQIDSTGY